MATTRRSAWCLAAVTTLVLAGCGSGNGGGTAVDDPLAVGEQPTEATVQFTGAGDTRIAGTVNIPEKVQGPVPGVLIVPGTAPLDRDGKVADTASTDLLYKDLSEAFTGARLATFRYDRRGAGQSRLEPDQPLSWDDMVTDARNALAFLGQRVEVGPSGLAVVGHDLGGVIALKLAAADPRVKAVVLVSTPGRPLVDVLADSFRAENGQESADAFRGAVANLLSTGALPQGTAVRPEHQSLFATGPPEFLRRVFELDPLADAAAVKVPVLVTVGAASTTVTAADADRLKQALGGSAEVLVAADAGATLQQVGGPEPTQAPRPDDHNAHAGGIPRIETKRDADAVQRLTQFLTVNVGPGR